MDNWKCITELRADGNNPSSLNSFQKMTSQTSQHNMEIGTFQKSQPLY